MPTNSDAALNAMMQTIEEKLSVSASSRTVMYRI